MLNIVIPMAGHGSRFINAGFKMPKPLIPINSKVMIQVVIENLRPSRDHRFIFICQEKHIIDYNLKNKLESWSPNCLIIGLSEVTDGAASTVLLAKEFINNNDPLMIANCDQYVDVSIDDYLAHMDEFTLDGLIMTMKANDPKWSFVKVENDLVSEVVEKVVVSDEATVGIYNFKHGRSFVSSAEEMILKDLRVNNEFYVAPVYNELVASSQKVGVFNIGSERNGMYGLGIPVDLEFFLKNIKEF
jgi:dTDP-glucose pyrophosphorylase